MYQDDRGEWFCPDCVLDEIEPEFLDESQIGRGELKRPISGWSKGYAFSRVDRLSVKHQGIVTLSLRPLVRQSGMHLLHRRSSTGIL